MRLLIFVASGCSVLINTSFNVRGEPIVCTPEDAYLCFMRTKMDVLVMGNMIFLKEEQPVFEEDEDWRKNMSLIDERERKFLLEWARKNQNQKALDIEIDKDNDSYFRIRAIEENCIMPYQISTLKEIKEYEQKVWGGGKIGSDLCTTIGIAILKNMPQIGQVTDVAMNQDQIPEFIYTF